MTGAVAASRAPLRVGMLVGSYSQAGGGVMEAVSSLSRALRRISGAAVDILSVQADEPGPLDLSVPVHLARRMGPAAFGYAPGLPALIRKGRYDVLHVHGLWMYISVAASRWAAATGRPYIVSPHGMLDPWAMRKSAWKKEIARRLFEDTHLSHAAYIHALCAAERDAIRSAGFRNPIAVLPNGVDGFAGVPALASWREALPADARVLLFLGRVTAKKQVLELIRAWSRVRQPGNPWHLVIVGPADQDYLSRIDQAIAAAGCAVHVHLAGAAYGEERCAAYRSADAFVLPSLSEGLPMAALEAFSSGLPALLTPQCNLPAAFSCGGAIATDPDESAIADGIARLFAMSDAERAAMGQRARDFAMATFDWNVVAEGFADLYRTVARRGHSAGAHGPAADGA